METHFLSKFSKKNDHFLPGVDKNVNRFVKKRAFNRSNRYLFIKKKCIFECRFAHVCQKQDKHL